MAADLNVTQYEYWYTILRAVMVTAGFTFTATKVAGVTTQLYMVKDLTIADNYVTIIQYHLNHSLLQTSTIDVASSTDKVTITINKTTAAALMNTRNSSYA